MKKTILLALVGLIVLFVLIQFIPIQRTNPPIEQDIPAPPEVKAILRQSCYDCHSNETVWNTASRIAPFSWIILNDVNEGRSKLNFSTWNRLSPAQQTKMRQEIWKSVQEGEMPPIIYYPLHPQAKLDKAEKAILSAWAQGK